MSEYSDEATDRVYTVVAVYNGELSSVEVYNTEKDAMERAQELRDTGIHFIDVDELEIQ
jgi:hypothetical protein